jgi:hypothetical protein
MIYTTTLQGDALITPVPQNLFPVQKPALW